MTPTEPSADCHRGSHASSTARHCSAAAADLWRRLRRLRAIQTSALLQASARDAAYGRSSQLGRQLGLRPAFPGAFS